ncbi:MAG: Wzz/FepE/Etk N-terminal domain-containing protein [Acidimicrobiales bacterium]
MGVREYLAVLRRQRWVVIAAVVVVLASAAAFFLLRTPQYQATATVLLRPGDPSERFFTPNQPEPPLNVEGEAAFATSFPVVAEAAESLPGVDPVELLEHLSVSVEEESAIVRIAATRPGPAQARDAATAVAQAFVDSRRSAGTSNVGRVLDELGAELEELQGQIADLNAQIGDGGLATPPEALNPATAGPPGSPTAARFAALVRYQEIFERQQLLLIEQSVRRGGAELVSPALLPQQPVGPGLPQSAAVAGFTGLLVGLGLALLRDHLDDRVRTGDDVGAETGLTLLAELPKAPRRRRGAASGAESVVRPHGALAEAVRGLRTTLQCLDVDNPVRRLVVTSPGRADGKSFVALNLATVYAQAGYRTVVVSADLRRPTLEAALDAPPGGVGLTSVVRASGLQAAELASAPDEDGRRPEGPRGPAERRPSLEEALMPTSVPKLSLLGCGPLPPNPSELLGSTAMVEVLDRLAAMVDIVVIDTPPVLAVTDAAILATGADGVVLVIAPGHTASRAVRRATAALSGVNARLLGIVLNKVVRTSSDNDDYYAESDQPAELSVEIGPSDGNGASPNGQHVAHLRN